MKCTFDGGAWPRPTSLYWIGHHLAAARPSGPTPQHSGELARRAASHDDFDRLRRAELLVTGLAIDRNLFVHVTLRHSLTRFSVPITTNWNAGVLKQELADILLVEAVAMDGVHVFRTEDHHGFRSHTATIAPDGRERVGDSLEHSLCSAGVMFADTVGCFGGEQRHGALVPRQALIGVQGFPRILFFVFGDSERKLARISKRRHVDAGGPRTSEIQQDQLQRAA